MPSTLANSLNLNSTNPLPLTEGGVGIASATAYAPICGGTTSTSALQSAGTGISNSGYVLTSNGASALPSFQAAGGGGGLSLVFFVRQTSDIAAATGDGTTYTYIYDTADVNVGGAYNVATGEFTVPATSKYMFQAGFYIGNLVVANTAISFLLNDTTGGANATYFWNYLPTLAATSSLQLSMPVFLPGLSVGVGHVLKNTITISGNATKNVDLYAAATSNYQWWACYSIP